MIANRQTRVLQEGQCDILMGLPRVRPQSYVQVPRHCLQAVIQLSLKLIGLLMEISVTFREDNAHIHLSHLAYSVVHFNWVYARASFQSFHIPPLCDSGFGGRLRVFEYLRSLQ